MKNTSQILKIGKEEIDTHTLIEISDKVDSVLHSYGYVVDHARLSSNILKTIKESYNDIDKHLSLKLCFKL